MAKTTALITVFLAIALASCLFASSITDEQQAQINQAVDANFDKIQSGLLNSIDRKISSLEIFKAKVESSGLSEEQKVSVTDMIDQVMVGLEEYKSQISQATTSDELIAAMKEANSYISENRDEIMKALQDYKASLNGQVMEKLGSIEEMLSAALAELAEKCPEQAAEIAALEPELQALVADIQTLQAMMEAGESEQKINAQIAKIYAEAMQLIPAVEAIATECTGYSA